MVSKLYTMGCTTAILVSNLYDCMLPLERHTLNAAFHSTIKELLSDHLDVVQFDIDDYSRFASEAGVSSVPTFILYQDGKEIWRQTGEMTGEALLTSMQEKLQAIGN